MPEPNFYFYFYKVKVWDDLDETEKIYRGITTGDSLSGAIENLVTTYGEKEIIDIKSLTPISEYHCLEIEDKVVADYLRKIDQF